VDITVQAFLTLTLERGQWLGLFSDRKLRGPHRWFEPMRLSVRSVSLWLVCLQLLIYLFFRELSAKMEHVDRMKMEINRKLILSYRLKGTKVIRMSN